MKQVEVAVFFADGLEEVEAITIVDYLRRADIKVITASLGSLEVTGSHGIKIIADRPAAELPGNLDGLILPGGLPGSEYLAQSPVVKEMCLDGMARGALVAAICAAPVLVLGGFGLLKEKKYTGYPGTEKNMEEGYFQEQRVVVDGNLITSRGPGTSGEFAIELIRYLLGDEKADLIFKGTLLYAP